MGRKLLRHMSADLDPCRDEGGRGESATMRAKTTRMTQPADWRRVCLVLVGESRRIILADPFWSQEVACWPIGRQLGGVLSVGRLAIRVDVSANVDGSVICRLLWRPAAAAW